MSLAHFSVGLFVFFPSFKGSLHILDNSPLSHVSFANTFSQFATCLIPQMLSSTEKPFLILRESNLPIISFLDCAFGVSPKRSSPTSRSSRCSPVFQESYSLCFTFRSVVHFELNFCEGWKVCLQSFLCMQIFCYPVSICQKVIYFLLNFLCVFAENQPSLFLGSFTPLISSLSHPPHTVWITRASQ